MAGRPLDSLNGLHIPPTPYLRECWPVSRPAAPELVCMIDTARSAQRPNGKDAIWRHPTNSERGHTTLKRLTDALPTHTVSTSRVVPLSGLSHGTIVMVPICHQHPPRDTVVSHCHSNRGSAHGGYHAHSGALQQGVWGQMPSGIGQTHLMDWFPGSLRTTLGWWCYRVVGWWGGRGGVVG